MTTVFVGSYSPADRPGIRVFDFDPMTGFRPRGAHAGVVNPSFLTLDPTGRYLYAVSETGLQSDGVAGSVHSFRIDSVGGVVSLIEMSRRPSGGDHPCHIGVDRGGNWVAVSNYGSGTVSILPVRADGALGDAVTVLRHSGSGLHPDRQAGPHAHSAIFCGDGRYLLVADLGTDRLLLYRFDEASGSCRKVFEAASKPGSGPRHMAFHPDGKQLFVIDELDNTLAWWRFDAEAGTLLMRGVVPTAPLTSPGDLAADVRVSSSGARVYVSNRGHDSIALFGFDPSSGPQLLGTFGSGGEWPRSFALAADGGHVLVANQHRGGVVVLPVNTGGELGDPCGRMEMTQPTSVALR